MKKTLANGRFTPSYVHGVGRYDLQGTIKSHGRSYSVWRSMMSRCYSEKIQSRQKTYVGCVVEKEWHSFAKFKEWFCLNYVEGWELDKDLLGDGKLYSKDTCCFLPKKLNLALPKIVPGGGVRGVRFNGSSYTAQCVSVDGKVVHLGSFKEETDAFEAYCSYKNGVVRDLSCLFKTELRLEVYNKLSTFNILDYSHKLGSNTADPEDAN